MRSATHVGLLEVQHRLGDILDGIDDVFAVIAAQLIAPLAPDTEDLHGLAVSRDAA